MSQPAPFNHLRGILPDHRIHALAEAGAVRAERPFDADQIQPSSIDLRLGYRAFRVRASFLPGPGSDVGSKLSELSLHTIDLSHGAVLETGCVYVVPLLESLALPEDMSAAANPKSSTGRLDVFTRVIADGVSSFDTIPAGYEGRLYAEICPQTFPIVVRRGSFLSQLFMTLSLLGEIASEDVYVDDQEATNRDLRLLLGMRFYF